jgi:hypothetical protein
MAAAQISAHSIFVQEDNPFTRSINWRVFRREKRRDCVNRERETGQNSKKWTKCQNSKRKQANEPFGSDFLRKTIEWYRRLSTRWGVTQNRKKGDLTATSGTTPSSSRLSSNLKSRNGQIHHRQMERVLLASIQSRQLLHTSIQHTLLITFTFFSYPSLQIALAHTETLHSAM